MNCDFLIFCFNFFLIYCPLGTFLVNFLFNYGPFPVHFLSISSPIPDQSYHVFLVLFYVFFCSFLSFYVSSCLILSYPFLSCPILSYPVEYCRILSYPILFCPVLFYSVLSYPIMSCPILSYPVISCLSYPYLEANSQYGQLYFCCASAPCSSSRCRSRRFSEL